MLELFMCKTMLRLRDSGQPIIVYGYNLEVN